ncbi:T9SS type A sorting domain-containing protein [Aureivirga marina]|uniref:T9SS type A sorting domain-containing protein n=1 Tax=Aureivirga marina TaxID=1182451 RepID=UPI0018C98DE7|nr:T9SS type A sorting domain-containing protein [Aureivirga marina]
MKKLLFSLFFMLILKISACNEPTNLNVIKTYATGFEVAFQGDGDTEAFQLRVLLEADSSQKFYTFNNFSNMINGIFSFQDSSLQPNTNYIIQVRQWCGNNENVSDWVEVVSETSNVYPCEEPTITENLYSNITTNNATVNIEFNPSWNALEFHLKNNDTGEILMLGSSTTGTFDLSNYISLDPNTNYGIKFRSECGENNFGVYSEWTNWYQNFTTEDVCMPPADFQIVESFTNGFSVSFEEVGSFHLNVIDLSDNSVVGNYGNHTDNFVNGAFTFSNNDIQPGTEYKIKVAKNCNGSYSEPSEILGTTISNCETPVGVTFSDITSNSATANMNATISVLGYEYKLYNNITGEMVEQYVFDSTEDSFTIPSSLNTLESFTEYRINIRRTCATSENSLWSDDFYFTTSGACQMPTFLSVGNITHNSAFVSFDASNPTYGYEYKLFKTDTNELIKYQYVETSLNNFNLPYGGEMIEPNTNYSIQVRRQCAIPDNFSEWTALYSFTTDGIPCQKPLEISFSNISHNSAMVNLTLENEASKFHYYIYKKETEEQVEEVATNHGNTSFEIPVFTELEANTTYQFKIRQKCQNENWSDFTELYEFTTIDASVGIEEITIDGLTIYPNPANNFVKISAKEEIQKIEIIDVLGKKVFSKKGNISEEKIDISTLKSGVYFIQITSNEKTNFVQILKN